MDLLERLTALAAQAAKGEAFPLVTLRTRKLVFGFVPWPSFDCHFAVGDRGECWGVMLWRPGESSHSEPYFGADFRKTDGARDIAWKHCGEGGWVPILESAEEQQVFDRAENAINRAYAKIRPPAC